MSDAVRHADLDPRLHEVVRMRVAQLNECLYCQAFREQGARRRGGDGGPAGARLRLAREPRFQRCRTRGARVHGALHARLAEIDAALFERLHAEFSDGEIVLLTAAIAKYMAWGRFVQVLDLEQDSCSFVPAA